MKKKEKASNDRPKAPISKRLERFRIGVSAFILIAVSAACFYTGMAIKDSKVQDLNDQLIRQEAGFEVMVEQKVEEARIEVQQEMSKQIEILNQQLEEENQAYIDLEQSMDDLMKTYEEVMELMIGPGWDTQSHVPYIKEPIAATAMLVEDLAYFFPYGLEPSIDIYLGWETKYPHGYQLLLRYGKGLNTGNESLLPHLSMDPAMKAAARIADNGRLWDEWIAFRRCTGSPFYGKGREIAYKLWQNGDRSVENCLATLEAESTYGLGGTCYFGILYGNYSNTIEGYCALLNDHGVSNDPWEQSCFWNMPGYPRYQNGFCGIVNTIKSFHNNQMSVI